MNHNFKNIINKIKKKGLLGSLIIAKKKIELSIYKWYYRNSPKFEDPTSSELLQIENDLTKISINIHDYDPPIDQFHKFKKDKWFSDEYAGGPTAEVWNEKLLEHWIASKLLGLENWSPNDIYVDIAACNSPWAKVLRERYSISAHAIDLAPVNKEYSELQYYRREDATKTKFADNSVRGASLQCAYEMFNGDNDLLLIDELARILIPGGKAIILPLYMHTHYCSYSSAEFFNKGYQDVDAKEYIRMDCADIPSSRKYDATRLKYRILDRIEKLGCNYRILALRNKEKIETGIYCHFILEIQK